MTVSSLLSILLSKRAYCPRCAAYRLTRRRYVLDGAPVGHYAVVCAVCRSRLS